MSKLTAMQELKSDLLISKNLNISHEVSDALRIIIEQIDSNYLKQEKQQIINAHYNDSSLPYIESENYYNKTFKNK